MAALREDSATGPDGLPTRLLKTCAAELAKPVHKLARNVLCSGRWPAGWCVHWIVPLHKKGSTWKPGNYRGVHLTAQLGKAVERFMQKSFGEHFCSEECSGANRFAYKTKRGARDLLAFLVFTWLHRFGQGKKYVLYCSDVAGAFDRVRLERLEEKLRSKKVLERWVKLFTSWLRERPARVVVGGSTSEELALTNMLFQGTVWGPTLWNLFYEDAALPVKEAGFTEAVFADDLNAFKEVAREMANEEALETAKTCQKKLHRWEKLTR